MINEFYIVLWTDPGYFYKGLETIIRCDVLAYDLLLQLKQSRYAYEEFEYLHFKSGKKIIIHNHAVKKL